jgi:hypothetical protein
MKIFTVIKKMRIFDLIKILEIFNLIKFSRYLIRNFKTKSKFGFDALENSASALFGRGPFTRSFKFGIGSGHSISDVIS